MVDDFELLDRWAQGDTEAASVLFDRYFEPLYRFFTNKVGAAADDLVQDTLLACIRARERFRRESSFRTFLFGTARHMLFHHYRDVRRDLNADSVGEARLVDLDPSPSQVLARRDEERVLLEALRRLPLDYQIAIELYEWEGLTGPEVARVLGISETAMRSRLHRAKAELKRQIEAIASSAEVLHSTLANLDGWARALQAAGRPT